MSEKEKEKEKEKEEEEEEILDHFFHHHPLILKEVGIRSGRCYGCRRYIHPVETAYTCRKECWSPILHEECAEMPREIRLAAHPQHTLIQKEMWYVRKCAVCETSIIRLGYYCTSSDPCEFRVHVGCAQNMSVLKTRIDHPSHPHLLTLLWRPGQSTSLRCDACGTIQKGNSYICIDCQYWIHESCAALPPTAHYHHHDHPLSLVYHLPLEYIKFDFKCDVCFKVLLPRYWVYCCEICRYVVHIKCAITTSPATTSNVNANAAGDEDVIVFPTNNAVEELIGSFITKVGRVMAIPSEIVKDKYKFHNHDHELSLISSSLHEIEEEEEKENSNDDDDGLNYEDESELVCDGCTMPIFQKIHKSSSSPSNESHCTYYMSCGECKYFLHWACFHLPPELPSHPLHLKPDHNLTLQTPPKLDLTYCHICGFHTNGLFYECTKCSFKADIKCVSLPDNIKHEAHPHHHLKLLSKEITTNDNYWQRLCGACGGNAYGCVCYRCGICEIILHSSCALLPVAVTNPRRDKHLLPLTFDASVNHPSGFYCDVCEEEMNPKRWMYHCRECDVSFHPGCFATASGEYRNIKFGQRYVVAAVHLHPVMYQLLTNKLRCDVCGKRKDYGSRGFQCHSHNCDFFMCLIPCGRDRVDAMQAVD